MDMVTKVWLFCLPLTSAQIRILAREARDEGDTGMEDLLLSFAAKRKREERPRETSLGS